MPSPNKEVLCTYHYDPLDRLIGSNPVQQDTLQRFYCKSRLATEIQGVARHSIVQEGDQLLAQQNRLGGSLETALLATDQQRSVMHTVDRNSLPIAYSPYGHAERDSTSLLGFNGERPDAITGYYLLGNGYRAFNPALMRFINPDSMSPFDKGGLNSYAYCLGDPVNRSDQTGNFSAPWIAKVSSSFIKTRLKEISRTPWYAWSTREIELVKHSTKQSPFSQTALQSSELFGVQSSSKRFSPGPASKKLKFSMESSPKTLKLLSTEAVVGQSVVPAPAPLRKLVDRNHYNSDLLKRYSELRNKDDVQSFMRTPRGDQLIYHRRDNDFVMYDMREGFSEARKDGYKPTPSTILKSIEKIRNE